MAAQRLPKPKRAALSPERENTAVPDALRDRIVLPSTESDAELREFIRLVDTARLACRTRATRCGLPLIPYFVHVGLITREDLEEWARTI